MAGFKGRVPRGGNKPGRNDRRSFRRYSQAENPSQHGAKFPDGPLTRLLNISRGGILIETADCMIPGGIVYVRLVAADAVFLLRGRVMRSRPSLMHNLHPIYESAVSFDETSPMPAEAGAGSRAMRPVAASPGRRDAGADESADGTAAPGAPPPTTYTVTASIPRSGPDLNQIFGLNGW